MSKSKFLRNLYVYSLSNYTRTSVRRSLSFVVRSAFLYIYIYAKTKTKVYSKNKYIYTCLISRKHLLHLIRSFSAFVCLLVVADVEKKEQIKYRRPHVDAIVVRTTIRTFCSDIVVFFVCVYLCVYVCFRLRKP